MDKVVRLNASSSLYRERPDLFQAAARGVRDVLLIQGYAPSLSSGGIDTAMALDEFEREAYSSSRRQLALPIYVSSLAQRTDVAGNTPDFIVTDKDMYAEGTNFVFGCTIPEWQLSVQSVARFVRSTNDRRLQKNVITHVARHEYAHMAGMNTTGDYERPDLRGGIYEGHCAEACTMHQVMTAQEVIALTETLAGHELAGFCMGCVASLRRKAV